METRGLGAGSYPEPKEEETRVVTITCTFKTELEVPASLDTYFEIKEYVEKIISDKEIFNNKTGDILIDDIEK